MGTYTNRVFSVLTYAVTVLSVGTDAVTYVDARFFLKYPTWFPAQCTIRSEERRVLS